MNAGEILLAGLLVVALVALLVGVGLVSGLERELDQIEQSCVDSNHFVRENRLYLCQRLEIRHIAPVPAQEEEVRLR